mmetsp:Transcript_6614/g.9996  ORF Transcript_6614/g.9996 Transcript_6614/m.9996 type:complete len:520 (+) Transcript_6614:147-1706(+)|eukprot:CAMPEP_0185037836 /NCGR_PEP_ID=MMETSP1103-20130426/32777_1 /TAXON_ID=36769 /ORGANISM="Paraphysomonas bandaiensis, Strain Caron Lab Isolate" /LENGTH=519 /DNA_ID=CAMNT_0027575999 /DNA_START=86 /DNA_END=1645 /DNA_ORIENTATION=-
MSISSDEVNYLIYRYLQENGFSHSAFAFAHESLVAKSSVAYTDIPPGALITFLQKGLEYVGIEEHISEDGTIQEFDGNYSLLSPFICQAVGTKEERKIRKVPQQAGSGSSEAMVVDGNVGLQATKNTGGSSANVGKMAVQSSAIMRTDGLQQSVSLQGHQGEVFMCLWNPETKQLASGSADGTCRLWTMSSDDTIAAVEDGEEVPVDTAVMPHCSFIGERYRDVTSVNWSPSGSHLATGCYDGVARVWTAQGSLEKELKEHNGPVFSLKWSKDGKYLLSGSYDRRSIVWDPKTGSALKTYLLHSAPVLDVDWSDSDVFATCSSDKTIFVCQVSSEESNAIHKFEGHEDEVNSVSWAPGGQYLASCSDDSTAKVWTLMGMKHDLRGHEKEIYTVRWTPTGPGSPHPDTPLRLCTASFDGTVKVWNPDTGSMVYDFCRHGQPVYSLAANPSGNVLAAGSLGGHVTLWSLDDGSLINEVKSNGDTFDVSWSSDGSMLCSCFSSGTINIMLLKRNAVKLEKSG